MRFLPHKTAYVFFFKAPPPHLVCFVRNKNSSDHFGQYLSSYFVPGLLPGTWNL